MGAAVLALVSSTLAGASAGLLVASTGRGTGLRPRRWLRDAGRGVTGVGSSVAVVASLLAIGGTLRAEYWPTGLGITCAGVAALIAFATWLLLVEPDDGGPGEIPDEPQWWPAFERDLEEWRRDRVPAGGRR